MSLTVWPSHQQSQDGDSTEWAVSQVRMQSLQIAEEKKGNQGDLSPPFSLQPHSQISHNFEHRLWTFPLELTPKTQPNQPGNVTDFTWEHMHQPSLLLPADVASICSVTYWGNFDSSFTMLAHIFHSRNVCCYLLLLLVSSQSSITILLHHVHISSHFCQNEWSSSPVGGSQEAKSSFSGVTVSFCC